MTLRAVTITDLPNGRLFVWETFSQQDDVGEWVEAYDWSKLTAMCSQNSTSVTWEGTNDTSGVTAAVIGTGVSAAATDIQQRFRYIRPRNTGSTGGGICSLMASRQPSFVPVTT